MSEVDITIGQPYYLYCKGTSVEEKGDADFTSKDCEGFTNIFTYEICIQQYTRSIDRSLTNSIKNDLIQSQETGVQSETTLPPIISCQGQLKIFHGQENFISCSVQIYTATHHRMIVEEGMGNLSLTDVVNVHYIQERLSYVLAVNATDSDFILPTADCGSTINFDQSSLPQYLQNKFVLGVKANGSGLSVTSKALNVVACFCMEQSQCLYDQIMHVYDAVNSRPAKKYAWLKIASCACEKWQCGQWCDGLLDPCDISPCYPGVSCLSSGSSFSCESCPQGMAGDGVTCEPPSCSDYPNPPDCQDRCVMVNAVPECRCPLGQKVADDGLQCEDVNECENNPLLCKQFKSYCNNTFGSFNCECQLGFMKIYQDDGDFVCKDIDECDINNGGCTMRCKNSYGSFLCECTAGFNLSADGKSCHDIDECAIGNQCSQICSNTYGLYECSCNGGFSLDDNKISCSAAVMCDEDVRISVCGELNTVCSIVDGEPSCGCESGYQVSHGLCINIDECQADPGICGQKSECTDTEGGYNCLCAKGYEMTPGTSGCTNIDECLYLNGGCDQKCTDTEGSFLCVCFSGYMLSEDGSTCIDIDECSASILSNCHSKAHCVNLPGTYKCRCHEGYTGNGIICADINECQDLNGGCSYSCTNTEQSYYCACPDGFQLEANGKRCVDIDECSRKDLNICQGRSMCINLTPGYSCLCPIGYSEELKDGNTTCVMNRELAILLSRNYEIRQECELCPHGCVVEERFDGSYLPTCICPSGYKLATDQTTCVDVDECSINTASCSSHSECTNQIGGYTCSCLPGFQFSDEYQTRCDIVDSYAWSQWLQWSECSADCDFALEKRTRQCISVDGVSSLCPGPANDYRICGAVNCEINTEEEDHSIHMIFASVQMLDWLLDMRYGIGFWVSEALQHYCDQEDKFPQCCNGKTLKTKDVVASQIISNTDDIVNRGYPVLLPKNGGIEIKLSARKHTETQFCSLHSEDQPSASKQSSEFVDPELLLAALQEFNDTTDEVYMKFMPVSINLGRRPRSPDPLNDPGFFVATAAFIAICAALHILRNFKVVKKSWNKTG